MKTYWDLSEDERGVLTREDVQRYLDAELMLKGVLKVRPLELEPVPTVPAPATAVYTIRFGRYTDSSVAFATANDAQAFLALKPLRVESHYLDGTSVSSLGDMEDAEVVATPIYTKAEIDSCKAELSKRGAIKAANERRESEYLEARKKQDEALKGLWDDWTLCVEREARLRAVAETFADYAVTAGSTVLAEKFLEKVYPAELIDEARPRFAEFT
jgi:hypothetical protein